MRTNELTQSLKYRYFRTVNVYRKIQYWYTKNKYCILKVVSEILKCSSFFTSAVEQLLFRGNYKENIRTGAVSLCTSVEQLLFRGNYKENIRTGAVYICTVEQLLFYRKTT